MRAEMMRWGMVVDLGKCCGCQACVLVCAQVNGTLRDGWRRVTSYGPTDAPMRERIFLPLSCMHCGEAPCLDVCPTSATFRREDGIVDVDYDLCIGCGYCIVACPYIARTIVHPADSNWANGIGHLAEDLGSGLPRQEYVGVCSKCDFCSGRIDAGLAEGLQPGKDAEATPACVVACSAEALHFGDLGDPDSAVSRMIREREAVQLQEDLHTDASVYYVME